MSSFSNLNVVDVLEKSNHLFSNKSNYSSPLSMDNISTINTALSSYTKDERFLWATYEPNEEIVKDGHLKIEDEEFSYSEVPLGLIVSGAVVIQKNGKATKRLSEGDFVGLFETSDWIATDRKRHIGNWTLISDSETSIVYFSKTFLKNKMQETLRKYLLTVSREDPVPQPITDMPLLDWTAKHTTHKHFENCAILTHTHFLPSNLPLFRHLAHLVGPNNTYFIDKPYSTVPDVTKALISSGCEVVPVKVEASTSYSFALQKSTQVLWDRIVEDYKNKHFSKLLILDDGGDLWLSIPHDRLKGLDISGVEQTQRGITRINSGEHNIPPVVSVASSGAKKIVEANFIGHSVVKILNKLKKLDEGVTVGIIGAGSIGVGVAEGLSDLKIKPFVYDPVREIKMDSVEKISSLDSLLNQCSLIIGTSGTDALRGVAFDRVNGDKTLVSASSSDIEFDSLLKLKDGNVPYFDTVDLELNKNLTFHILNGGFPINFDRLGNAADEKDISLTRALLYVGIMQSYNALELGAKGGVYSLDILSQEKILERWAKERGKEINIKEVVDSTVSEPAGALPTVWVD